ncbi:MAG: hypothetical protein WD097_01720 [Balneolales bacterium]
MPTTICKNKKYGLFTSGKQRTIIPGLKIHGLVIFLLTACTGTVSAQFPSAFLGGESFFYRQLDAMQWQYGSNLGITEGKFSMDLDHMFHSRFYLIDGDPQNIQDENQLNFSLQQWLTNKWALTGDVQTYSFTTTSLRQDLGHAGILYNPHEEIRLFLKGGFMSDRRSNNLDQGWSGRFHAQSLPIQTGDFVFHPHAEAHYAKISPREYATLRFRTDSEYRFNDFLMRANLQLASGTRESYQPSSFFNRGLSNIIESIQNDSTLLDMQIRMPLTGNIGLSIDLLTLGNTRTVEGRPVSDDFDDPIFNTRSRRRELQLRATTDYAFNKNQIALGFQYSYINRGTRLINTREIPEDQTNRRNEILRSSNFDQSRFELFTQNRFSLSDRNELILQAQSGILRYDTPEINLDDRDELNYLVLITDRHEFSPYFDLTVRAGGEATHYVYLSTTRSIENNWRRIIRLSPEINWQPHNRIQLRQSFQVRANYTIEDFQLEGRPKNDQSSREYAVQSNVDIVLAQNWQLEINGSRSELRIGRLYWNTFQETPTDTLITYNTELMIVHQTAQHRIGIGGRYYLRRDYLPQTTLRTEVTNEEGGQVPVSRTAPGVQYTRQMGPSVDIDLNFLSGNHLVISGWLQRQSVRRRLYTTYPDDVATAFQKEERQRSRRTYPNLEIRAVFSF